MSLPPRPYFEALRGKDLEFFAASKQPRQQIPAKRDIVSEGASSDSFHLILDGWAYRYTLLGDGRRQIFNFMLPGDLVGLHGPLWGRQFHSVRAITDMTLLAFPRERLNEIVQSQPEIALALLRITAAETAILDENLTAIGRRSAKARLGYLFLALYARLHHRGLTQGQTCAMPLTQEHLADALGLSVVHVSRTLQQLRTANLAQFADGQLTIFDLGRLQEAIRGD